MQSWDHLIISSSTVSILSVDKAKCRLRGYVKVQRHNYSDNIQHKTNRRTAEKFIGFRMNGRITYTISPLKLSDNPL